VKLSLIICGAILSVFILVSVISIKNDENSNKYVFYPDKKMSVLQPEIRTIVKGKTKQNQISNLLSEFFLGPINNNYYNCFGNNIKLRSIIIEDDVLNINLNKDFFLNNDFSQEEYYIFFQSVVVTVCYNYRDIKKVKFYFDGIEYKYASFYKIVNDGFTPDFYLIK